jgi:hypothetical protein
VHKSDQPRIAVQRKQINTAETAKQSAASDNLNEPPTD